MRFGQSKAFAKAAKQASEETNESKLQPLFVQRLTTNGGIQIVTITPSRCLRIQRLSFAGGNARIQLGDQGDFFTIPGVATFIQTSGLFDSIRVDGTPGTGLPIGTIFEFTYSQDPSLFMQSSAV